MSENFLCRLPISRIINVCPGNARTPVGLDINQIREQLGKNRNASNSESQNIKNKPNLDSIKNAMLKVDGAIIGYLKNSSNDKAALYKAIAAAVSDIANLNKDNKELAPRGLDGKFIEKVFNISNRLNANPLHLLAIFSVETGGRFSPGYYQSSGAVGLIQFTEDGVAGLLEKKVSIYGHDNTGALKALSQMTPLKQLEFVDKYLGNILTDKQTNVGKVPLRDIYLAVFAPAFVRERGSAEVYSEKNSPAAYEANSSLDSNIDKSISVSEIEVRAHRNVPELYLAVVSKLGEAKILKAHKTVLSAEKTQSRGLGKTKPAQTIDKK